MIGIDQDGIKVEKMRTATRWSRRPLSAAEVSGGSSKLDRDIAIWTLVRFHGTDWDPRRLAVAFGISIQRVYQILQMEDKIRQRLQGA